MSGECDFCGEHALECNCKEYLKNKKRLAILLYDFFISVIAEYSPESQNKILISEVMEFVQEWMDKYFKGKT